jgi:hypothetical protein
MLVRFLKQDLFAAHDFQLQRHVKPLGEHVIPRRARVDQ